MDESVCMLAFPGVSRTFSLSSRMDSLCQHLVDQDNLVGDRLTRYDIAMAKKQEERKRGAIYRYVDKECPNS